MTLVLQTNIAGQLSVWLKDKDRIVTHKRISIPVHASDRALAFVDHVLQAQNISWSKLHQITVVRGPGPFTAVRIGLIIANTIAKLQDIPVVGIVKKMTLSDVEVVQLLDKRGSFSRMVKPWYGKKPNITMAGKKRSQASATR